MTRFVFAALLALAAANVSAQLLDFTDAEVRAILRHGPWPAPWSPDPSNRVSGNPEAIEFGERLFFEPRLSPSGKVLCATCHAPFRGFQDARVRAFGLAEADRNTPSLFNVRNNRWFGWDGAGDSLWAQSIRPILEPREMGGSQTEAAALVRGDPELSCRFQKTFGTAPPAAAESVLAGIGKALAAFQETIVSGRSPFDEFRDALGRGDRHAAARYSEAAQRGLKIFIGKGACITCHTGPNFTNGEFHDTGLSHFAAPGRVDPGRHGGIKRVTTSRYNLLGPYNDDQARTTATGTRHVALEHRNFGEFRVPSLRNATFTAPYSHDGQLVSLADVVRHYSELNIDRLHSDGEQLLKPLRLTPREQTDLVVFIESLSPYANAWRPSQHGPCK